VVDTAAGIAANSLQFCEASQEVMVVVCNDPASIADAYATVKVLNQRTRRTRFRVLVNMTHSDHEAREIFARLLRTTDRFLDVALDFVGVIPFDRCVAQAPRSSPPTRQARPGLRSSGWPPWPLNGPNLAPRAASSNFSWSG
jgi:flagellar biosynthesis protein FlhG